MSSNSLSALSDSTADRLDLTPAQRGIWYAQQLAPENPMYQIGQFVEILGPLDTGVLADAVAQAVAATDALNRAFGEDHTGPFQSEQPNPARLEVTDLSGVTDPEAEARTLMDADLGLPRDVRTDQLLHTELIRLSDERHFFYQRVHHLMLDGYSAVLVLKRVAGLYDRMLAGTAGADAAGPGDAPAGAAAFGSLRELQQAEQNYAGSRSAETDRSYWAEALRDAPPATGLSGRPDGSARSLVRASRPLPPDASAALASAAASVPALILTSAALYLHRITGEREVSVALPVTARRGKLAKSTPSMLSNILPIRTVLDPGATIRETVTGVGATLRGALIHQRFRYEDLSTQGGYLGPSVNILPVLEDISFGPARGTMNILSTGPIDDLSIVIHGLDAGATAARQSETTVQFEGNAALYTEAQLQEHLDRFVRLLGAVATQPEALIASVSVTTASEESLLLAAGEAPDTTLPGTPSSRNSSAAPAAPAPGPPSSPPTASSPSRNLKPGQTSWPGSSAATGPGRAPRWPSGSIAACCCPFPC